MNAIVGVFFKAYLVRNVSCTLDFLRFPKYIMVRTTVVTKHKIVFMIIVLSR